MTPADQAFYTLTARPVSGVHFTAPSPETQELYNTMISHYHGALGVWAIRGSVDQNTALNVADAMVAYMTAINIDPELVGKTKESFYAMAITK